MLNRKRYNRYNAKSRYKNVRPINTNDSHSKNNTVPNKNESETANIVHCISEMCKKEKTIDEQLSIVLGKIVGDENYFKWITYIVNDLNRIVKNLYPHEYTDVHPFGSAVTGLALVGSDVDLFIEYRGVLPENFAKSLQSALYTTKLFFQPIIIPARIPIIRCEHYSSIACDISYSNFLGVENSKLIKSYLDMDRRLKPLILIIKFVMKHNGLISNCKITSFTLTILILFYLQQLDKPLIPTVYDLQLSAVPKRIVANWNVSFFIGQKQKSPELDNVMTIPELILGFFKFYSKFDFGLYIISCFTGKTYLKPIFVSEDTIPNEFSYYKNNVMNHRCERFELQKSMCVQGPFNHAHNVSRNVTLNTLLEFQMLCQKKVISLGRFLENKDKFIRLLFEQNVANKKKKKKNFKTTEVIYIGSNMDYTDIKEISEETLIEMWGKVTVEKLIYILTRVLRSRVNYEVHGFNSKEGNIFSSLMCELDYPELVTKLRKIARNDFNFPKELSTLDKEIMISDYLYETKLKNVKGKCLKFVIKCLLLRAPTHFEFQFLADEEIKQNLFSFEAVFKFIKTTCLIWLQAIV